MTSVLRAYTSLRELRIQDSKIWSAVAFDEICTAIAGSEACANNTLVYVQLPMSDSQVFCAVASEHTTEGSATKKSRTVMRLRYPGQQKTIVDALLFSCTWCVADTHVIVPPEMNLVRALLTVDIRHSCLQILLDRQCLVRIAHNSFRGPHETPRRVRKCVPHERDITGNCHCLQKPCSWNPDMSRSIPLALSTLSVYVSPFFDSLVT
jgi:hypothetical protein